jgi:hypothetical protein
MIRRSSWYACQALGLAAILWAMIVGFGWLEIFA